MYALIYPVVDRTGGLPTILSEIDGSTGFLTKTDIYGEVTSLGGIELLLMSISVVGFVSSVIVHLCSLFHIWEPPRELVILISVGIIIVLYPALIIQRTTRKKLGIENFKAAMVRACPGWLAIINGSFIIYALGLIIFLIFKKHFTDTTANDFPGFSGIWMASYSLLFTQTDRF